MDKPSTSMAQQIDQAARIFQEQRTGRVPNAVTVVLSGDTLVVTMHDALSPAEKALARTPEGAAQVQEFHRRLFASSLGVLRKEIKRITSVDAREAAAEVETSSGPPSSSPYPFSILPGGSTMARSEQISSDQAEQVGIKLGIDWTHVDLDQFRRGLEVELEHGARDPETNVTNDDLVLTGKIAWAHLKEFPDYYTRLEKMETEADAYWASRRSPGPNPSGKDSLHTPAAPAERKELP